MKKGFTLIEIIGSIVILGIIAIIAFPALITMLKEGNEKVNSSVKDIVISSAANYVNERKNDYPKQLSTDSLDRTYGEKGNIQIKTLLDEGYIENSFYEKYCHIKNDYVVVTSNQEKYKYEYKEVDDNEEC